MPLRMPTHSERIRNPSRYLRQFRCEEFADFVAAGQSHKFLSSLFRSALNEVFAASCDQKRLIIHDQ